MTVNRAIWIGLLGVHVPGALIFLGLLWLMLRVDAVESLMGWPAVAVGVAFMALLCLWYWGIPKLWYRWAASRVWEIERLNEEAVTCQLLSASQTSSAHPAGGSRRRRPPARGGDSPDRAGNGT